MVKKALFYISHWEAWHWFAKYILIAPFWFWNCLKARSFWFFTSSNPAIIFGGFIGEAKKEIYGLLPPSTYPKSIYISPPISFAEVEQLVINDHFAFPLAVKPDVGMMGLMFRRIESMEHLRQYHDIMPVDYIIQDLVTYPIEVSVFYYRYPNEAKGHITGFLKKEPMQVIGDGKRTLRELILNYPRAQFRLGELFSKHESKLNAIVPAGEHFYLSFALNLSRGGRLISLEHEKDERLLKVFDDLSHYSKNFYYGRYDIRCTSIDDLKSGRNFSILEYNGCGAEPHHVYGNGNSLFKACKILVDHWNILYAISMQNYERGIPRWSYLEGLRFARQAKEHFRKLAALDSTFQLTMPASEPVLTDLADAATPGYLQVSSG
jgi:hypothetical protein